MLSTESRSIYPLYFLKGRFQSLLLALVFSFVSFFSGTIQAQVEILPPDRRYIFLDDQMKRERAIQRKREFKEKRSQASASKAAQGQSLPFDISAETIDFDTSGSVLEAAGNVIISYSTLIAEASQAKVNTLKNEAELIDDVRVSDVNSNLLARSAKLNLETGEAQLEDASLFFAEGDYHVTSKKVTRSPQDEFTFSDTFMTTCICPDGDNCPPWSIYAEDASIQRDGYGQAWNSSLRVYDVPVFYLPYIFFPAKTERQSGFLPATFGVGRRTGFSFALPFYWDINDSTDATITAVYEAKIRTGAEVEFRKMFARNHNLEMGILYFDEAQREGRLLGTRVDGIANPELKQERYAGFIDQSWSTKVLNQPFQLIVDGHYVSDNLLPREMERDRIARQEDRFVTSTAVARTPIGDSFSLDLSAEYNQAMVTDNDYVFQRLPELSLTGMEYYRPFGENPYGLRLVVSHSVSSANFVREKDYMGMRSEFNETVKLPFFVGNYVEGSVQGGLRGSYYSLSEVDRSGVDSVDADDPVTTLPKTSDRLVPSLDTRLGTVFEKVLPLEDGNFFKFIGELGKSGKSQELVRLKHTIEPNVRHLYVADVDQSRNPQFDSNDHLAQRSVLNYGVTQRFFGRYEPRNPYVYGVEETAPRVEDLQGLSASGPIDEAVQFGVDPLSDVEYASLRRGEVQELLTFRLSQTYDLLEDRTNTNRSTSFSDLAADVAVYPNEYFRVRTRTDFNLEDNSFSSYLIEGQLSNSRGDLVRSRLRFVENSIRQLESGVEFGLTDRIRLGYYSRWDDQIQSFIEQRGGIRITSACNCWMLDLLVTDQTNPDDTRVSFNVTLMGLGEIGNTFFTSVSGRNQTLSNP